MSEVSKGLQEFALFERRMLYSLVVLLLGLLLWLESSRIALSLVAAREAVRTNVANVTAHYDVRAVPPIPASCRRR